MSSVRETSIEAYHQIKAQGLLSQRRMEVYEALFRAGPCTGSELAHQMHTLQMSNTHGNIRARLNELRELGVVRENKERVCSITRLRVIEWDVTDKLPAEKPKATKIKCQCCRGRGYLLQERLF